MSGLDGIHLLDTIKSIDKDALVIVMTAYSSIDSSIAALRKGAYDYITKPFVNEYLLQTIRNALAHRRLFNENRSLRRDLRGANDFSAMVGTSAGLQRVFDLASKVAATSANVLIQGESGTGKELIAKAIHFNSRRADKPFLAVNCGALPESLLESELFGHVKGAFTGAHVDKPGLFRSVAGGTLFLDEIADTPPALQVKLLRALQEHEVMPVGASRSVSFNARIIAATNKDLEVEIEAGRFREDLYYRLNVVEIVMPPLRHRRDDIQLLIRHFIAKSTSRADGPVRVQPDALAALLAYEWPGNVRELENVVERAVIIGDGELTLETLPEKVRTPGANAERNSRTLDNVERQHIETILRETEGDKGAAATLLGIDLSTLYRKLRRYHDE
jgi:DNA-binding NtrC family response regulator